jgi:iron complex outermembrane receptor protein
MVLLFNRRQDPGWSQDWGEVYLKSRAFRPGAIGGPFRDSVRRFVQTSSTLLGVRSVVRITGYLIGHLGAAIPLAFLLSLMAPLQNSWAQIVDGGQTAPGNLKQLSLEQLGDIEVTTVSKEPVKVSQTPAAIYVITQEDIRRSGATSIPEALRLAPGVEVGRVDSDHWSIAIRGFAGQFSKSLLVLIDGRSVYTPLFSGVYWDVQNLMLEDVDRIEVIRGPGGTIWGANAVNGVINIITKSANETQGALATLGSGDVNQGVGAARYGGSVGKDFNYRVYGIGLDRGPEFHADGDGFDRWRIGQMGFRTDGKKGDRDTFTVQGDIYRGVTGERVSLASFSPVAETRPDDKADVSGGNIVARWRHQTGEGSDIQFQTYFDRTNFQDLELGETRNTFDFDFVQHQRIRGNQELTWGLGARLSPSNFIQTSAGVDFLPHQQTDTIYSGFVQYEIPIVRDRVTLTAGTKLEHNNFSGFEYQPGVRLLWTPTPRQSLWAAVTRAVRTPSRLDQDVQFAIAVSAGPPIPIFFDIAGNPKFVSEKLLGYEAGYRVTITPRLYLDLAGFYNTYDDLQNYGALSLMLAPTPTPAHLVILVPYANGIEGNTTGGEIAPEWKITSAWQVRGSYSFLHMGLRDAPGFTDTGMLLSSYRGSSPRHGVVIHSLLNLPKRFEFDLMYRYSSALPAQLVTAYQTGDVRLGWHLGEHWEFSAVGQNLLQPFHPEFGGDPGPLVGIKRSAYAKITWASDGK